MFAADPIWPALLGTDRAAEGLADLGAEAGRRQRAALTGLADRARAVDPETLDPPERVTRRVILAQARAHVEGIDSRLTDFAVTDLFVSPAVALLMMLPMITVTEPDEADAHLGRLAAIPVHLEQALERHRAGIADGLLPVAHLVRAAIAHLDRYLADPDADPLLRQEAPDEEFESERRGLLATRVRPAFAAYRDALETEVLPHGRPAERPGIGWLPGGAEIYASLARVHTTTDRTPAELHRTGLDIIERLGTEYAEIGRRVFGTGEQAEVFRRMRTDPELRWRDAEELLGAARAAIGRAQDAAPVWFGAVPPQPCVVEAVPAAEAPGGPPAYYMPPSADGAQPGVYFANTHEVTERFRHAAEAVAFHEAVPGHHFQLSLALELAELPLLRRISEFTAYSEGWGLYAERLADEMGLYSGDVARLGMLALDSMRAGRLVVDTGLHAHGWSRQQAVDFLLAHTPMPPVEIESEVDRYIAWPGQALAYMVGRLEIERIRARAAAALGERFDLRAFHDLVLGGGALPLSVLDDIVTEWVRKGGASD
ncbi:DUF885 domain-containing protein [Amycolatopsis antarctica]|nr:DUF885 domain-containing protein [Amycolatopsis antarctica]